MEAPYHEQERSTSSPVPFGKYLLLGRIGKGGMAEVFLARTREERQLVAIKLMRKSMVDNEQYVEMFIREGQLSLLLQHPAIVQTYDVGFIQKRHFICMEYISGIDLSLVLRRSKALSRLPLPHACAIALRIFEGLSYAHEVKDRSGKPLNLVNRDVSPSNVRISFEGEVKLLDFGIAKLASALSSEIGMLKGKISHMSPEQVRGLPLDRRSDIFSAGIILHELLTQEKLFRADSDFQLMDMVRRAEVRPPSASNSRVPPELDAIVLKSLKKNPEDRYQTGQAVASDLQQILSKYRFSWPELGFYVRDICREEWTQEQKKMDAYLTGQSPVLAEQGVDDEPLDITFDEAQAQPGPPPVRSKHPPWLFVLLGLSLLLLLTAVVLLLVRR